MKKKIILPALSIAIALLVNSCASNSPAKRIEKNPEVFEKLSSSDKELAQQGKIKRGMHKDAVLIAWGKPSGHSAGSRQGKSFEKWNYTRSTPIYTNSFGGYGGYGRGYGGYGRGYGGYGRSYGRRGYRGGYGGFGYGSGIAYIPYTSATVEFDSANRVTDWATKK